MKKVLLDANVLAAVIRDRNDVVRSLREGDFEPCVPRSALNEIKSMGGALAKAVELYVQAQGVPVVPQEKPKADDDLLALAKKGYAVCTLDSRLKTRLKKAGCQIITLKRNSRRPRAI